MDVNFFFYFKSAKWMGQLFWKAGNLTVNAKDIVGREKEELLPLLIFISLFTMFLGLLLHRGAQHTLPHTVAPSRVPPFV